MDKTYNPQAIESRWYQTWESKGYFEPQDGGTPYCIMLPPPNVTGTLHMGHAFQHTLMDALIRYRRMQGRNTHWQAGTDHAGIATQMVVERQLNANNSSRLDLGRDKFVERVWDWKKESGDTICRQMRRLGDSPDWRQERFTMDEGLSKAVTEVFVRLYQEKLIYRGNRLVNWDPVLHTAISDLEVISEEENGHLWHIRYPIADSDDSLIVATTRPETMLGDTAVAIHPDDERYQKWIGKEIQLPLSNRKIPIIADEYVDPSFGTGCVKITPAHDFNDYEIGQRHSLAMINILTIDAKLNENVPECYQSLDRYDARKQVVNDLEQAGLLVKTEDHKLMVPRGDRSGAVIEPYLTNQWYVKTKPLAEPAIKAVETGQIRFVPENWSKTYYNWMHNIEDWCISRQLWWGHRIPAWYDEKDNIYVGHGEDDVRKQYNLSDDIQLTQDDDVLDTWFSSALWPFSTLGWPEQTEKLSSYYPSDVLVTGFDIIFFWVARMVMMGLKFMGDVPFREVYITGLIRDEQGQKMSKAKGNILDPLDLIDGIGLEELVQKRTKGLMQPQMAAKIEKSTRKFYPDGIQAYGTDALRFTLTSLATTGRDIKFDMKRMEGYRNFCNKLWNAARYVLMNTQDQKTSFDIKHADLSLADRWILSSLQTLTHEVQRQLDQYRFDLAAQALHEYIWNEYCDWYIEFSKPALNSDTTTASAQNATRATLLTALETLLRLAHPFIPFITEEIWQQIAPLAGQKGDSIMLESFPSVDNAKQDQQAESEIDWIKAFIIEVRKIRAEMDIKPGKTLSVLLQKGTSEDKTLVNAHRPALCSLAKLESIEWLDEQQDAPESAVAISGDLAILIPLAGLIDKQEELKRLAKEQEKIENQYQRINAKLSNEQFVNNAPKEIVEKEQAKLDDMTTMLDNLKEQVDKINRMG